MIIVQVQKEERPDPISPLYFRTEDKKGGPTAVVYGFEEAFNVLYKDSKKYSVYYVHPLYIELYKLHTENVNTLKYDAEHPGCTEIGKPPPGFAPAIMPVSETKPNIVPETQPGPPVPAIQLPLANKAEPSLPPVTVEPSAVQLPSTLSIGSSMIAQPSAPTPTPVPEMIIAPKPQAEITRDQPTKLASESLLAEIPAKKETVPENVVAQPESVVSKSEVPKPENVAAPSAENAVPSNPPSSVAENVKDESFANAEKTKEEKYPGKSEEEIAEIKKKKKCDEIFAEYLNCVAKNVRKDCYSHIVKFVFLFRECLNQIGNRMKRQKQQQNTTSELLNMEDEEKKLDYCLENNVEQAPEISNEFVTVFLEDLKPGFGKLDTIELTQNLCHWLFINEYTCSRLNLIPGSL